MTTTTDHPRRDRAARPRRRALGAVVATAIATGTLLGSGAVAAAPPTTDPTTAAGYGARWLAARFDPAGYVPGPTDDPSIGATLQDTLALAAAQTEEATFDAAMAWLADHAATVIDGGGTGADPGRIGSLLLLTDAAGTDPTDFGGVDLPAALLATLGALEPGLFGGADPTFDGVYRQSLAVSGLQAAGVVVPAAARQWLVDQQCDATTPAAAGGWQPYRADPSVACVAPDPVTFSGPDTNATAMALQALVPLGGFGGTAAALDFLDAAQADDGGFAYIPGGDVDPNSTALVVLGVSAAGEDPGSGRWVEPGGTPVTSLLSWQVGCDAPAEDQGGFASPFSAGAPDPGATGQAVWGAAGRPFPLGSSSFTAAPVPCQPDPTTTTTTTTMATTTSVPATTTVAAGPTATPVAVAVTATPRLAG